MNPGLAVLFDLSLLSNFKSTFQLDYIVISLSAMYGFIIIIWFKEILDSIDYFKDTKSSLLNKTKKILFYSFFYIFMFSISVYEFTRVYSLLYTYTKGKETTVTTVVTKSIRYSRGSKYPILTFKQKSNNEITYHLSTEEAIQFQNGLSTAVFDTIESKYGTFFLRASRKAS
jgi:hypothetical protein